MKKKLFGFFVGTSKNMAHFEKIINLLYLKSDI